MVAIESPTQILDLVGIPGRWRAEGPDGRMGCGSRSFDQLDRFGIPDRYTFVIGKDAVRELTEGPDAHGGARRDLPENLDEGVLGVRPFANGWMIVVAE